MSIEVSKTESNVPQNTWYPSESNISILILKFIHHWLDSIVKVKSQELEQTRDRCQISCLNGNMFQVWRTSKFVLLLSQFHELYWRTWIPHSHSSGEIVKLNFWLGQVWMATIGTGIGSIARFIFGSKIHNSQCPVSTKLENVARCPSEEEKSELHLCGV